jgi:hypothetical protein
MNRVAPMNLTSQEAAYAGTLGAVIGIVYTVTSTTWGDATLEDVVLLDVLSAACIGAVAGILAFALRRTM